MPVTLQHLLPPPISGDVCVEGGGRCCCWRTLHVPAQHVECRNDWFLFFLNPDRSFASLARTLTRSLVYILPARPHNREIQKRTELHILSLCVPFYTVSSYFLKGISGTPAASLRHVTLHPAARPCLVPVTRQTADSSPTEAATTKPRRAGPADERVSWRL